MIEIFEIFWSAKIELRVIILATLNGLRLVFHKRKQKEQHQERFLAFGIGKIIKES